MSEEIERGLVVEVKKEEAEAEDRGWMDTTFPERVWEARSTSLAEEEEGGDEEEGGGKKEEEVKEGTVLGKAEEGLCFSSSSQRS